MAYAEKPTRYQLDTCVWEITLACNYRCAHCGSSAGHIRTNELTTEEALGVADQLAELGCRRVVLIGGEAFLRHDWVQIAQRLKNGGIEPQIITNGSLLKGDVWDDVERAGVRHISVSIDGHRENADKMRVPGSFDAAMEALEQIKAHGLFTAAITVANSGNVSDLELLHRELSARGVDAWQIQLCSPFGNAGHARGLVPSPEQINRIIEYAAAVNALQDKGPRIFVADNVGYHTQLEGFIRGRVGRRFPGCAAGLSVIGIDSVGNVRGCESLYDDAFIEGNLRTRSLRDIWDDPEAFAFNRKFSPTMLAGKCHGCDMGDRCAGGCRSLNYFYTGNMYESGTCVR